MSLEKNRVSAAALIPGDVKLKYYFGRRGRPLLYVDAAAFFS